MPANVHRPARRSPRRSSGAAPRPPVLVRLALGLLALSLAGCLHPQRARSPWNVSSVTSDYSPALQLAVAATVGPDDVTVVRVDSGVVIVPGELRAGSKPIMRTLTLTAILAVASRDTTGVTAPWTSLAESAPVALADSLRYGETQRLAPFTLAVSAPTVPRDSWLVFRVDGPAVTEAVRLADGQVLPGRLVAGGIRVFACADWNVDGRRAKARAAALRRRYSAAC